MPSITIGRLKFDSVDALMEDIERRGRSGVPPNPGAYHAADWYAGERSEGAAAALEEAVTALVKSSEDPDVLGCAMVISGRWGLPYRRALLDRLEAGLPDGEPLPGRSLQDLALSSLVAKDVAGDDALRARAKVLFAAAERLDLWLDLLIMADPEGELSEVARRFAEAHPRQTTGPKVGMIVWALCRDDPSKILDVAVALGGLGEATRLKVMSVAERHAPEWFATNQRALALALSVSDDS